MDDDRRMLHELLLRARRAAKSAVEARDRATRLVEDVAVIRRRPIRCAWCGRIEIGGVWRAEREVPPEHLARRRPKSASHGICPRCLAELRASGRSR